MNRPPPTDRQAPTMTSKTGQLLETLTDQVAALIDSELWAALLSAAAKFHSHSANNQLLILLQAPQATRVAGFRCWQSLGRQVRQGEKVSRSWRRAGTGRPKRTRRGRSTTPAPPATAMGRQPARKAPDSCGVVAGLGDQGVHPGRHRGRDLGRDA